MTAPNHIAGGIVFTGVFGGIVGTNILQNPYLIPVVVLASILPDIDRPGSLIARLFPPLSKWLNRKYGHRTLTHSLLMCIGLTATVRAAELSFGLQSGYAVVFFLAYFSHLIFDMMTLQGVPLFYPFFRNPCVIPGRQELRFRTGNLRTETMIFSFFIFCGIFLQPLMRDGFWTTYNRVFGTMKHLHSEFTKSDDLLSVTYQYRLGSEVYKGFGYCIESPSTSKATLLLDGEFLLLDEKQMQIGEVKPEHTGKQFRFETQSFAGLDADNLNAMLVNLDILELEIVANNEFRAWVDGVARTGKRLQEEYVNQIQIEALQQAYQPEAFVPQTNPRIATLEAKLAELQAEHEDKLRQYQYLVKERESLENALKTETDLYEKERMTKRIQELRDLTAPEPPAIAEVKAKIQELQRADAQRNREQRSAIERKNREELPEATTFAGVVTWVGVE